MKKLCFALLLLLLGGCARQEAPAPTQPQPEARLSAWYAYWDYDTAVPEALEEVSLFAVSYREDGSLAPPEQLPELLQLTASFPGLRYLCFVNDLYRDDGSAQQKSPELLENILATESSRASAINDMIAMTKESGCGGIDLDYEQVHKHPNLWEGYTAFLRELYAAAQEAGLSLRVILETGWNPQTAPLPEGPSYTVMCYNLFGYHSGPGPKADFAFLKKTADKFSGLSGLGFALATGGFDWDAGGKVAAALTTEQAQQLCRQTGSLSVRDPDSGAMVFTYRAQDGVHSVWYADGETIALWARQLWEAAGADKAIDLWRAESAEEGSPLRQMTETLMTNHTGKKVDNP